GQRGRDVDRFGAHAQVGRQQPCPLGAVVVGVALGQDQGEHPVGAECAYRQRGAHGTVDAARDRDHQAAAVQLARSDVAQPRGDAVGLGLQVDVQHGPVQSAHGVACCSVSEARRTLPDAVRGSAVTNSTWRGTLYGARRARQCALTRSTPRSGSVAVTTYALMTWPSNASSTPTTAASITPSISAIACSM